MTQAAVDSFLQLALRRLLSSALEAAAVRRRELEAIARGEDPPRRPVDEVRAELAAELEQLAAEARSAGYDPAEPLFVQARHVIARTVDTVLAEVAWGGDAEWLPLAGDYPPPDGTGVEVDEQLAWLLDTEDRPPAAELVQLYLLALESGVPAADGWQPRLLEVAAEQFPELVAEPEVLFPDAYRRQQLRGEAPRIADPRPWWIALGLAVLLLLMVSVPLWWDAVAEVLDVLERFREHFQG